MGWISKNIKDTIFENIETTVDIPLTSEAAWGMYPKYNWVYSTSRLLEMQHIGWSPLSSATKTWAIPEMPVNWWDTQPFEAQDMKDKLPSPSSMQGWIFTEPMVGEILTTDVAVLKGEIKWACHYTTDANNNRTILDTLRGDVELRISALTTLHFRKFAGVISVDTAGHNIVAVRLHMTPEMASQYGDEWLRKVIRIYNRRPWGK